MSRNDDFSFLSKRMEQSNAETEFFQLYVNNNYVDALTEEDQERDSILLKFEQRIWKYDFENNKDDIKVFNSFHKLDDNTEQYFMHDIYYCDASQSELIHSISCPPTLSFRTLILDKNNYIKFGLPIYYGKMIRLYPIKEALVSMYISDCIRRVEKIELLDFFYEKKAYYYNNHSDFSVSHRSKENDLDAIPFGNYFNKVLYFSEKEISQRFTEALDVVESFLIDYDSIVKYLSQTGLGLEIHGQNLLVVIDNNGNSIHRYLYRDFGNCTLSEDFFKKNSDIEVYYKTHFDFDFKLTRQVGTYKSCVWTNIRLFIFGFLFYNLDRYQSIYNLNFNVYDWGDNILKKCDNIKEIY